MIAIVGSPPFIDQGANDKRFGGGLADKAIIASSKNGGGGLTDYGQTPGQLAALPPGAAATETRSDMAEITDWTGCYDNGWKGLITDAAFAHPAKFAHGLIRRIYQHLLDEGAVQPGDTIIDPFGGVALGGLYAMQNGLHWVGCELEQKFVDLGNENIALWNSRFAAHFPRWGSARLLQGDSRRLAEVVSAAGCVVGSPPYINQELGQASDGNIELHEARRVESRRYAGNPNNLGSMPPGTPPAGLVTSPPFAGNTGGRGEASRNGIDAALFDRHGGGMKGGTGADPANLDNLPMGQPPAAVVSSPPYIDSLNSEKNGIDWSKVKKDYPGREMHEGRVEMMEQHHNERRYGVTDGQLGALPPGTIEAVISSPPFAGSVGSDDPAKRGGLLMSDPKRAGDVNLTGSYGTTPGQLGGMATGDVAAVVGSPPYEGSIISGGGDGIDWDKVKTGTKRTVGRGAIADGYGESAGQIGIETGETFWSAARLIVEQCAMLLPPGAPAVWVVKNYIKDGREVDFTGQWQALCEACGFETVHIHRAWLIKNQGAKQATMDGDSVSKEVARKSFFRRLHERKNPHLVIDWETVLCTVKR